MTGRGDCDGLPDERTRLARSRGSAPAGELIIPGGIIVFLGLGCFVVAGALFFGLVDNWFDVVTLFFVASFVLLLMLRMVFMRFFAGTKVVQTPSNSRKTWIRSCV